MPIKIQVRRGTAAQWTSANPILSEGEVGLETDTRLEKVGDGVTAWASLSYRNAASPSAEATSRSVTAADHGKTLNCTAGITLTIPSGLPPGFFCAVHQAGTSQVTVAAGAGVTLHNVNSQVKTSAQYAAIGVINTATDVYSLSGSTGV